MTLTKNMLACLALLALSAPFASAGCSDAGQSRPASLCVPDALVFCRCEGGARGQKRCKKDGMSFEECNACTPDAPEAAEPETKPSKSPRRDAGCNSTSGPEPPEPPDLQPFCQALWECCTRMADKECADASSCRSVVQMKSETQCEYENNRFVSNGDC